MPLTNAAIKNSKPREKQYRMADGQSLYLLVKPNRSKLWQLINSLGCPGQTLGLFEKDNRQKGESAMSVAEAIAAAERGVERRDRNA